MMKIILLLLLLCCLGPCPQLFGASEFPDGVVDESIVATAYQGGEILHYEVSWSGGVKIGELHMEVKRLPGETERYELRARVKDSGLFHFFYPVNDTFVTVVEGPRRLPVSYTVEQREGRDYEALRFTEYDQQNRKVRYRKNEQPVEEFEVVGDVYNEFSSFFFTRIIHLDPEQPVMVPTFSDGKRHEVVVRTGERSRIKGTVRGDVNVLSVTPIIKFKGLYDKDGATMYWLTDDSCRVPVLIKSKIVIGSLVAELVSYSNPSCPDQSDRHREIPAQREREEELPMGD